MTAVTLGIDCNSNIRSLHEIENEIVDRKLFTEYHKDRSFMLNLLVS